MASRRIIAEISADDLRRWQEATARRDALSYAERVTLTEAEAVLLAYFRLTAELAARYNLSEAEDWRISLFTGEVYLEV